MASYQQFTKDKIVIRYFKDSNVLYLIPTKGFKKDALINLKNKLETYIYPTPSLKTQNNGLSFQLDPKTTMNIPEMLKTFGAAGGETIENPASVAKQPAEKEAKDAEQQTGAPEGMPPAPPQQPGIPPQEPMQQSLAAGWFPVSYTILYEGVFGSSRSFGERKKPGRRIGKYWEPIEKITGKNRSKILDKDIFSKRKEYSRKPKSSDRNKVLRALDKAFNYFYKKTKEIRGESAAERFADDYYAIDNLNPKDYSLKKKKLEPANLSGENEEGVEAGADPINGVNFIDFADVLDRGEDSYDDIDVEQDVF